MTRAYIAVSVVLGGFGQRHGPSQERCATEQLIELPQRRQKSYYSGKKKRHTLKTENQTTLEERIIHISHSYPGSAHDCRVFKGGKRPSKEAQLSGCQGIADIHKNDDFPYKASKNKPLDAEEKEHNTSRSWIRIKVEHIFGNIKIFKMMANLYRNKRKSYGIKFNSIAGIVNLRNGLSLAEWLREKASLENA